MPITSCPDMQIKLLLTLVTCICQTIQIIDRLLEKDRAFFVSAYFYVILYLDMHYINKTVV